MRLISALFLEGIPKSEARRLVAQGAVKVDSEIVREDVELPPGLHRVEIGLSRKIFLDLSFKITP